MSDLVTPTVGSDILLVVLGVLTLLGGIGLVGALFSLGREPYRK